MQVWINSDNPKNVAAVAETLENVVHQNGRFKAFLIFMNQQDADKFVADKHPSDLAVAFLKGPQDGALKTYQVNPDPHVANTIFVYKDRKVQHKFVNLVADPKGLEALNQAIKAIQ